MTTTSTNRLRPARTLTVSAFIAALALAAPTSMPPHAIATPGYPTSLTGKWSGPVSGDQSGFDVVADISDGRPLTATVNYPQLGCQGTWMQNRPAGNGVLFITEQITHRSCVPSQVTLTPQNDGTVIFRSEYYSASQQRTFKIHATMSRG